MDSLLYSHTSIEIGAKTVHLGFTSAAAGNLGLHVGDDLIRVLENRKGLEAALGLEQGSFVYLNQVHGTEVFDADRNPVCSYRASDNASEELGAAIRDSAPIADAAISLAGKPLAVMVADCIPALLVGETAEGSPVLAVAHAGRRGLLDGVLQTTVAKMQQVGARQIRVWLGPSICGACYEVPESMREESVELIPAVHAETSWGTAGLDLPAGAVEVLENLPAVVEVSRELATCTLEEEGVFSHRRGEPQGRIAGLIWIQEK